MTAKKAGSFSTTYILLGAFAILLGVLGVYVLFDSGKKPSSEGYLFEIYRALKMPPNEITRMEIERGADKIVFARQSDGRWRIVEPIVARADSDRVEAVVAELLGLRRDDKGADVKPDLAVHGLDKPGLKITLQKGERSTTLSFGKTTIGGDRAVVYVLSSDDPKTPHATRLFRLHSLLKEKPPENADIAGMVRDLDDYRTKKLLGEGLRIEAAPIEIESITLSRKLPKGEQVVALSRNKSDQGWHFDVPPGFGDAATDIAGKPNPNTIYNMSSLLATVLSIEVHDVKDFLPAANDLGALGLDPAGAGLLRIDIKRNDSVGLETLWIGTRQVKAELDKSYVRYGNEVGVAQVNAEKPRILQKFMDDPSVLRDRTVLKLRRERIDALDITQGMKTFELRKINGKWKVGDGNKSHDANDEVTTLIDKLVQVQLARGFPPAGAPPASMGFDAPAVEIKLWQDGVPAGAAADSKAWPKLLQPPSARLLFGRKDAGDLVFVRRIVGDSAVDFKIPDELLTLASKGRFDYVNAALSPYDPNKVSKLSFLRDGETWELERDASEAPANSASWTVVAPASKKGKVGNALHIWNILTSFADTKPPRVIAESPSAEQLALWGLDPAKPVFKLSLKLRTEPNERVYFMGNAVLGTLDAYAKTSQSDFVFYWPQAKIDLVTKGQVLDPVLYSVQPPNVKSLKLRGWVDPAKPGEPRTLELERKPGGAWYVKGDGAIEDWRPESFLSIISRPSSLEQVVAKTGPKPEHGLDVKQGALEVQIDLLEGKPVTITLKQPL